MKAENRMRILGLMFLAMVVLSAVSVEALTMPKMPVNMKFFATQTFWLNLLLIGGVVFVAQIFVFANVFKDTYNKSDTQKTVLYLALGALCIFAAYKLEGTAIWQHDLVFKLFYKEVLINAAVMAVTMFLVVTLFLKNYVDMSKSETKAAVVIAIILISLLLSFKPLEGKTRGEVDSMMKARANLDNATESQRVDTYLYVWEEPLFMKVRLYLLGDEFCYGSVEFAQLEDLEKTADKYSAGGDSWFFQRWTKEAASYAGFDVVAPSNAERTKTEISLYEMLSKAKTPEEKKTITDNPKNKEIFGKDGADTWLEAWKKKNFGNEEQYCYTKYSYMPINQRPDDYRKKYPVIRRPPLEGWGILRGSHLYVFLLGILVYYMMFRFIGGQKDMGFWIKLVIVWLAADNANSSLSQYWFFQMAYWVLMFSIYQMFREGNSSPSFAGGFAFGLVNTLACTTFARFNVAIWSQPNFFYNFWAGWLIGRMVLEGWEGGADSRILGFTKDQWNKGLVTVAKAGGWGLLSLLAKIPGIGIPFRALKEKLSDKEMLIQERIKNLLKFIEQKYVPVAKIVSEKYELISEIKPRIMEQLRANGLEDRYDRLFEIINQNPTELGFDDTFNRLTMTPTTTLRDLCIEYANNYNDYLKGKQTISSHRQHIVDSLQEIQMLHNDVEGLLRTITNPTQPGQRNALDALNQVMADPVLGRMFGGHGGGAAGGPP